MWTAQDAVHNIKVKLLQRIPGLKVFLDVDAMESVDKIEQYINESDVILLFVSKGYFLDVENRDRFWCVLGSIWARFWVPSGALLATQDDPKIDQILVPEPVGPQEGPRGSQEASKRLPRGAQEGPKTSQESPKRPQEAPKRRPRGPKRPQEAPKVR